MPHTNSSESRRMETYASGNPIFPFGLGVKGAADRAAEKLAENRIAPGFRLHGGTRAGPILGCGVARNMNRDQTV
jgi:hypothetical protein